MILAFFFFISPGAGPKNSELNKKYYLLLQINLQILSHIQACNSSVVNNLQIQSSSMSVEFASLTSMDFADSACKEVDRLRAQQ